VAAGVSIYSPHTSLDSAVGGINDWLARGLGPGQTSPITQMPSPPEGQDGCGIGRLHVLHNPMPVNNLTDLIKTYLNLKSGNLHIN
jgi:putative NIF3 family GTP cyclohydrolase 1 type 2